MARPRRRNWCSRLRATERGVLGRTGHERVGATELTLAVGLPKGRRPIQLHELRLQDAHAPQLQRETALDLPQFALQVHVLPLLQHRTLLLAEPLLLDARPVGHRGEEALVLVCQARTT